MNLKWLLRRSLLVVGVLLWPAVLQAAEVTVKMGISVGGDHLYVQMSKLMAKEIEKRVPGRVDWKLFPGAQLGRNDVIMRGLKTGTHIASMQASWIAALVPAFELFEAPFMFTNREQVRKVAAAVQDDLAEELAKKGVVLVGGIGELGFRQISNNVRPIVKPADLNGVKLRTPGNPFRIKMFRTFGANPTPMSSSEVYMAIRQGVVDGQENPLASIWAMQVPRGAEVHLALESRVHAHGDRLQQETLGFLAEGYPRCHRGGRAGRPSNSRSSLEGKKIRVCRPKCGRQIQRSNSTRSTWPRSRSSPHHYTRTWRSRLARISGRRRRQR